MADLVLGPMLRYVGDRDATVWVETDAACEVEVLGARERTFHVEGHHYALVPVGERIRQALDLDHWPSFARSFRRMEDLLRLRGGDAGGPPPAGILLLGGDVHTAYVAEVDCGPAVRSRVWQLVCSPFRTPLAPRERRLIRAQGRASRVTIRRTGAGGDPTQLSGLHQQDLTGGRRPAGRRRRGRRGSP